MNAYNWPLIKNYYAVLVFRYQHLSSIILRANNQKGKTWN